MTNQLQEQDIEELLIDLLEVQGYEYFHGSEIAPYSEGSQRESFASVVLEEVLKSSLDKLNPDIPGYAKKEAFEKIINLGTNDLMANNEKFHTYLTEGITVEFFKDGETRSEIVKLMDVENPINNNFAVVNQFVIKEGDKEKRLDVVVFVNGLPLVVIELKSATSQKATLDRAFAQIGNYKKAVPSIFHYNALVVISDGIDARTSSISAPFSRYLAWKSPDKGENGVLPELQILVERMMRKDVLVNLIRYNTVFENEEVKDEQTGIIKQVKVKKIAAYHQYYAVQKAVGETLRAIAPKSPKGETVTKSQNHRGDFLPSVLRSADPFLYGILKEKAIEMRNNPTKCEALLWNAIKNKQLGIKFRQQHIINKFIVDFCSIKEGIVIEVDGEIHDAQKEKDAERTQVLENHGYHVLRFKNEEIENNLEKVLERIKQKTNSPLESKSVNPPLGGQEVNPPLGVQGAGKIGVVWHTQGSGKSLSMVFYVGRIVVEPEMRNPTIVILTDRNDLDDQLFGTFGNCQSLLRQKPVQAEDRDNLKELLQVSGGGIVFTTIQKFYPEDGQSEFDELSDRRNIVVVADEAHRSQYGFGGRIDDEGNLKYGNAKYLRDALPNASFIGFTGTPIEKEDRDTQKVFGGYIDVYDIAQAVKDGATVPISYESRLVKIKFNQENLVKIDSKIDNIYDATNEQLEQSKKKLSQINSIVGHPERLQDIAKDIVEHFEKRREVFEGKAMVVAMTRQIAVDLYAQIVKIRPHWHSDDITKGKIKVVMTGSSDDPESFQAHHTTKRQRKDLALRLKDVNDELDLVIVQSMWLTGFDAPILHTMYIDKKMQGANLMQAIARVNRVYKDKPGGLIVDYIGIGQDLRNAMAVYTQSGGEGVAVADIAEVVAGMKEKFEIVEQMFHGFEYSKYFEVEIGEKLQVLLQAGNFILSDEKLKNRFISEVGKLSKLFAMAIPSPEAEQIKDDIAFFQAVKSRIAKFSTEGGKTNSQVDSAVKQIVDEALASGGVIDIFQAASIKAPSLDILSDEFLLEVKNMEQKNIAFELLRKLLSDEVRVRKTKNMAQGKKFSEMLSNVIKRYHNNQIDTAQVIEELSEIAKEMRLEDKKAGELGLTPEEYAFYSVLKENDSTNFLEDQKMKELIHVIVDIIRKNATVDWEKREDVRAKLRLTVKKILMRYGYPPDLARMEADKVLKQSELLAGELTK